MDTCIGGNLPCQTPSLEIEWVTLLGSQFTLNDVKTVLLAFEKPSPFSVYFGENLFTCFKEDLDGEKGSDVAVLQRNQLPLCQIHSCRGGDKGIKIQKGTN